MKKILIISIAAIFVIIALFLVLEKNIHAHIIDNGNIREITIDAKRFEYTPNIIKIKEGEKVRLKLNNIEGEHGFSIPELGIEVHDEKGVVFAADKKGEFEFYCHHFCGGGHESMKGVVIVQ